jgi:hypothetical protein
MIVALVKCGVKSLHTYCITDRVKIENLCTEQYLYMRMTIYYRIDSQTVMASVRAEPSPAKADKKVLVVVLDVSGSMATNGLSECIEALEVLAANVSTFHLITYNDDAHSQECSGSIPPLCAVGMTSFEAAFMEIIAVLSYKADMVEILFFTDGLDTCSHDLQAAKKNLRDHLARYPKSRISTIGIEGSCDTEFMLELKTMGSVEGEYGFFTSGSHIEEIERYIMDYSLGVQTLDIRGQSVRLVDGEGVIYFEDITMDVPPASIEAVVDYISYRTQEDIKTGSITLLKTITYSMKLKELFDSSGSLPREYRKVVRRSIGDVHSIVSRMYNVVIEKIVLDSRELSLLVVAARNARSSKFNKALAKRGFANADLLSKEESIVDELSAKYRENGVVIPESECTGCAITLRSATEVIQESDCIGVCVTISERKEVYAMCPEKLVVSNVGSSTMSFDGFMEQALFSLEGVKVYDSSRIAIDAIIPMYINKEHFDIVLHKLQAISGIFFCNDPSVGTRAMCFYMYYCVVRHMDHSRVYPGEFYEGLRRGFVEAMKITNAKWKVVPTPAEFEEDVRNRVSSRVNDLSTLKSAWIYLGYEISPAAEYLYKEEEVRRLAKKYGTSIKDCTHFKEEEWVAPYVRKNVRSGRSINALVHVYIEKHLIHLKNDIIRAVYGRTGIWKEEASSEAGVEFASTDTYVPIFGRGGDVVLAAELRVDGLDDVDILYIYNFALSGGEEQWIKTYDTVSRDRVTREIHVVEMLRSRIKLARTSGLSRAAASEKSKSTENYIEDINTLHPFIQAVVLNNDCYLGRNIFKYACGAKSVRLLNMIVSGRVTVGELFEQTIQSDHIIQTVVDREDGFRGNLTSIYHGEDGLRWRPTRRKVNLIQKMNGFDRSQMRAVFFSYRGKFLGVL